ncbi:hypothetical protein, partial [Falsihalocynthiibacter sp. CO-5D18]|uniref:hypothetical protein n=1 Tax=Falsihalocynthiibacter sp. CO-5D18 TaxID=3240872 RepID=UPI0035106B92
DMPCRATGAATSPTFPSKTAFVLGDDPLAGWGYYTPRSMDWATHKVLIWRFSNTPPLGEAFCETAEERRKGCRGSCPAKDTICTCQIS